VSEIGEDKTPVGKLEGIWTVLGRMGEGGVRGEGGRGEG
jgi:hypothetical protein